MPFHGPTFAASLVVCTAVTLLYFYKRASVVQPAVVAPQLSPTLGPRLQPALLYATIDPAGTAPRATASLWDDNNGNG